MLVVVTRAVDDARRTCARLAAAGHEPLAAPVLEIRALAPRLPAGRFDATLATSAHAFAGWPDWPADLRALRDRPLFAVGAQTAEAARAAEFRDVRVASGDAEGLVNLVRLAGPQRGRFLYLAGRDRKPTVEASLAAAGASLAAVETYAAAPVAAFTEDVVARLAGAVDAAVLHFSRRSAALALDLAAKAGLGAAFGRFLHAAISEDAAAPLAAAGLRPRVARTAVEAELFALLPP